MPAEKDPNGWPHIECPSAPGRWREVKEEPLGAVYGHELQKLREESAALQLNEHDLQEENTRLRDANSKQANAILYGDHIKALREENAMLKERLARHKEDCNDQRLRMQAADMSGGIDYTDKLLRERTEELEFCQREIRRLDPRLAAARWGK